MELIEEIMKTVGAWQAMNANASGTRAAQTMAEVHQPRTSDPS